MCSCSVQSFVLPLTICLVSMIPWMPVISLPSEGVSSGFKGLGLRRVSGGSEENVKMMLIWEQCQDIPYYVRMYD